MTEPQAMTSETTGLTLPATEITARPVRKVFHLNDILCLTTGLMVAREGVAALHRLVGFVMDEDASARNTALNGHSARACVMEQLAFLGELNTASLYSVYQYKSNRNNPYLDIWLDMMALRYGAEHTLVSHAKWQAQKNSHKLPLAANTSALYAPA